MKKSELRQLVKEGLWANINAKKKAGKKSSHKNSKAYKAAAKAGDKLEKTKNEGSVELRIISYYLLEYLSQIFEKVCFQNIRSIYFSDSNVLCLFYSQLHL